MNDKINQTAATKPAHGDERYPALAQLFLWADDRDTVEKVVIGLAVFCALLFVVDLFYHRHAYFGFEGSRGFYPIAGFFAFAIIVLAAAQLRRLIKRPENYYGRQATNAETYPDEGLDIRMARGFAAPGNEPSMISPETPLADSHSEEGDAR